MTSYLRKSHRRCRLAAGLAVALVASFDLAGHVSVADARTGTSVSLVLCTPARLPMQGANGGHRLVRQIGNGPFFAPTRPAMFFLHPGDRCAWHPGGPEKG